MRMIIISGYGILVTSVLTFLLMFLPRARQMVAMGKDELFTDSDQLGPQVTVMTCHPSNSSST